MDDGRIRDFYSPIGKWRYDALGCTEMATTHD